MSFGSERNHIQLYKTFRDNAPLLGDFRLVAEILRAHCLIKRMHWRGTRLRIVQFPEEFAKFLVLLRSLDVRSYLEVGTSTGGSFMAADAYLRAVGNGSYRGSVGYDRTSKLRDFDAYKEAVGTIEFRHSDSKTMNLGDEQFDAGFIDARHLKDWVWHDYKKVKGNCKIVAFHDIVLVGSTVHEAWSEIKLQDGVRWWEFIDISAPASARCGIGVVMSSV